MEWDSFAKIKKKNVFLSTKLSYLPRGCVFTAFVCFVCVVLLLTLKAKDALREKRMIKAAQGKIRPKQSAWERADFNESSPFMKFSEC